MPGSPEVDEVLGGAAGITALESVVSPVFIAQIPEGATLRTRSVGVVRVGATKADKRRALKRARLVRSYLIGRGLPGEVSVSNGARTTSKKPSARRVHVLITYTITR